MIRKLFRYIKYLQYKRVFFKLLWIGMQQKFSDPEGYATQSMKSMIPHLEKVKRNYLKFGNATGIENSTEVTED